MNCHFFTLAKNASMCSDFNKQRLGCVITYKNRVISSGFNCCKTHPLQKKYNKYRFPTDNTPHTLHAEIYALAPLVDCDIDWSRVEVYIYRSHKDGSLGLARPCKSCMALIKTLGIKKIHYTTENGYATEYIKEKEEVA